MSRLCRNPDDCRLELHGPNQGECYCDDPRAETPPDVDRATALDQARTRVIEAAKAYASASGEEPLPAQLVANYHELAAAVDALEEVERRG